MEFTSVFDRVEGICTIHVTGRYKRPEDSLGLQQFARHMGDKHGCQRFLIDKTQAEIIANTLDTYITGTMPLDFDHKQVGQRVALLYASVLPEHKFMENVAFNRGYQLRAFDKMDEALEWLRLREKH